jgi:predicted secreted acid phosphatase
MLKSISIIGCVVTLLLLLGCSDQKETVQNSTEVFKTQITQGVNVWCDKETNTEYLITQFYKSGGITVRYAKDGSKKHCTKHSRGI